MVDEIRADYAALQQISARFSQRAEVTVEMLAGVQQAYQPLEQGSWIGEGADAFFAEMAHDVTPAIGRLIAALAAASEITGSVAQAMQQADQAAASPFRNDEQGSSASGGGSGGGGSGSGSGNAAAASSTEDAAAAGEMGGGGGSSGAGSGGGGLAAGGEFGGAGLGSSFGTGGFGGGGFSSPFGFGDAAGGAAGETAAAPSRFRYQVTGGGGAAAAESGFSRPPFSGGAIAEVAGGANKSGLSLMASMLAGSPFLATLLGKFGKKKNEA